MGAIVSGKDVQPSEKKSDQKRQKPGTFKKGNPGGGRPKGVPNKMTADLKAMILGALSDVGGQKYLAQQAIDNPGPFMTLIGKVLPMQIAGGDGSPVDIRRIEIEFVEPKR